MSCPSADRLDLSRLNSVEWSNTSSSLSTFLDHHGESLPHVVKVLEGFCGDESSWTIDSGQILILHALRKETKILAKDSKDYDLYIPSNFQVKVEMIPKNAAQEYSTVRDVLKTFPNYFRVLEDIPSQEVTSGTIFKIIPQDIYADDSLVCVQVGGDDESRKVTFSLSHKGRFQPLSDSREFFIDEVYSEEMDNLPMTVHFVKAPNLCMQGINVLSLNELGNIRLIGDCETESVFASVINNNERTASVFPKNLLITVEAAKNNALYQELRESISETQEKIVKRIQRLNKMGLHQGRNPIRQFPSVEILPPLLVKPRSQSTREESKESSSALDVKKQRSNSTPPLPPKQYMMKLPKKGQDTKTAKKSLLATTLVPCPRPESPSQENCKIPQNNSDHKPPPPLTKKPLLPPKGKLKSIHGTASKSLPQSSSAINAQSISEQQAPLKSPPVPPPRKRRGKTTKSNEAFDDGEIFATLKDDITIIDEDMGYICMDHDLEERPNFEYEPMDRPWMPNDEEDQSNMTLEELFGGATLLEEDKDQLQDLKDDPEDKYEYDYVDTERLDINFPCFKSQDSKIDHEYKNTKGLDATSSNARDNASPKTAQLSICKDSDSLQQMSSNSNDISSQKIRSHSYENTKGLKLEQVCGATSSLKIQNEIRNQEPCKTAASVVPRLDDHREKLQSHGYENTSHLTFKQRDLESNDLKMNERAHDIHYENTKLSTTEEPTTQISLNKYKINDTFTKTHHIVQEFSKKRLSPIGMEQDKFYQDDCVYTAMNENNIDCTNDYSLYTPMEDSFDTSLHENNSYDEGNSREQCDEYYEPVSLFNSKMEPTTFDERESGVGSPVDVDADLHYHDVDISSIISSPPRQRIPSDNAYEDVEIPFLEGPKTPPKTYVSSPRPIPPQRRQRVRKTDDCTPQDENVFDINQNFPMSPSCTSLQNKIASSVMPDDVSVISPKSQEFEELDDLRLHLAKKESIGQALFEKAVRHREKQMKNIKDDINDKKGCETPSTKTGKDVKCRPPAPPPKKPLNYIKVDTKSENPIKTFKKKTPTKYSEVDTKPRCKADDMEYVADIELYLFEQQNKKIEQMMKAKPDTSHDSHKSLVYSSSAPLTDREDFRNVQSKKHSTVPPPKPKRLFLKSYSGDPQQNGTKSHTTSPSSKRGTNNETDVGSSLHNAPPSSPAHPNRMATTKKPPKPVPRKTVRKTDQK